jgi:Flp pilus assembly protein TadB
MTLGALCIGLACFAGLQAICRRRLQHSSAIDLIRATTLSPVEWRQHQQGREGWYQRWLRPIAILWGSRLHLRPARLDPMYLIQAGIDPNRIDGVELRVVRLMSALVGGMVAGFVAILAASGALALVPLFVWAGYIAPARYLAQRRRRRQAAIQRELPQLVSMVRAFTVAGMPLERALHVLSANTQPDSVLRQEIRLALGRYGLGSSIEEALLEIGARTGMDDVATLVGALAQCKRIGGGLEPTLRDQEQMARMNQQNRSTAQAASVSTKLLAVLGGIYLPEFVILIMVPLFWGIMQRAFG